jgi:hypothetical protein
MLNLTCSALPSARIFTHSSSSELLIIRAVLLSLWLLGITLILILALTAFSGGAELWSNRK